ncbi:glycosyltransferase [Salipiger bermudensis]|uniref:glycosyltransferase n=1 Tax=Salipiger bermudensis TaxID=344736 RepID=UPI001CD6BA91|nr:glycosyltransferase [Salipiger bermudensis]MCA0964023.1 glycosyl transferase [Salipiger bermudensis]
MSAAEIQPAPRPARIVVFGFDVGEISQIRRIRALVALGHDVHSFTMRRDNMNTAYEPDWPNTHLFMTSNENLPKRAVVVAGSILKMTGHREMLQRADVIIARNLDMLAIAWAARAMAGASNVPLVYECLDINGALCREGRKGDAMRAAEQFLLRRIEMLVVSSPGFVRNFFEPVQRYDGPWALWENKLAAGSALPARPVTRDVPEAGRPLRVGWVGTIRCAPSLALLSEVAARMGAGVEIHIHGVVHRHVLPEFDAVIAAHSNMVFHGAYQYPQDLPALYGGVDLVWSQDLWQRGNNSDWLLPNRIYEASWAGCPSIAVAGTETGRRVADDGLGWVIDAPEAADLVALLTGLTRGEIAARGQALLDRPAADFVQSPSDIAEVIDTVRARAG